MDFPVLFSFYPLYGFDLDTLLLYGYKSPYKFFMGNIRRNNKKLNYLDWSGLNKSSTVQGTS